MNLEDMKTFIKKNLILVIILLFLLVSVLIFLSFRGNKQDGSSGSLFGGNRYNNSEELESAIEVYQSNYSLNIFGSSSNDNNITDTLNYSVFPMINISISGWELEDFKVNSIKVTNAQIDVKKGRGIRSYPNHTLPKSEFCLGYFYEGCDNSINPKDAQDMGSEKEYVLLSEGDTEPKFYDETPTSYFMPNLKFTVVGVGSFDSEMIMERDGVFNSANVLEYSGVNPEELVGTFSFDVEIDTSYGLYRKGFVMDVTADEFVGTGASNMEIDIVK
jgi:hypothetical protein